MSTNDYVKFVTQQFVTYMDSPKQDRKQKRQQRRSEKELFSVRWFGVLPLSLKLLYKKTHLKQKDLDKEA
ncbi:MAG: YqzE family protein [Ectobacillus sp.]